MFSCFPEIACSCRFAFSVVTTPNEACAILLLCEQGPHPFGTFRACAIFSSFIGFSGEFSFQFFCFILHFRCFPICDFAWITTSAAGDSDVIGHRKFPLGRQCVMHVCPPVGICAATSNPGRAQNVQTDFDFFSKLHVTNAVHAVDIVTDVHLGKIFCVFSLLFAGVGHLCLSFDQ